MYSLTHDFKSGLFAYSNRRLSYAMDDLKHPI